MVLGTGARSYTVIRFLVISHTPILIAKYLFTGSSEGWRHFLVCISSASERKETWINVHPLLGHPFSENFVSWCQTLKNSSASFLCIQETYLISTISQFESDLIKCVHLKCICVWCLDNWFCQVSLLTHFPWQG